MRRSSYDYRIRPPRNKYGYRRRIKNRSQLPVNNNNNKKVNKWLPVQQNNNNINTAWRKHHMNRSQLPVNNNNKIYSWLPVQNNNNNINIWLRTRTISYENVTKSIFSNEKVIENDNNNNCINNCFRTRTIPYGNATESTTSYESVKETKVSCKKVIDIESIFSNEDFAENNNNYSQISCKTVIDIGSTFSTDDVIGNNNKNNCFQHCNIRTCKKASNIENIFSNEDVIDNTPSSQPSSVKQLWTEDVNLTFFIHNNNNCFWHGNIRTNIRTSFSAKHKDAICCFLPLGN